MVSTEVAAQVKWWGRPAGRPELQRLIGARRPSQDAVFFSRSGFTEHAMTYARENRIALFKIDLPATVIALNAHAEQMERSRKT